MTENLFDGEPIPRVPIAPDMATHTYRRMTDLMRKFTEIDNDKTGILRGIKSGLEHKVGYICWLWGERPESRQQAVDLQSLYKVFGLEDAILDPDKHRVEKFDIDATDPFWTDVDAAVYNHLSEVVATANGAGLAEYKNWQEAPTGKLFTMNEHAVSRAIVAEPDDASTARIYYFATPYMEGTLS